MISPFVLLSGCTFSIPSDSVLPVDYSDNCFLKWMWILSSMLSITVFLSSLSPAKCWWIAIIFAYNYVPEWCDEISTVWWSSWWMNDWAVDDSSWGIIIMHVCNLTRIIFPSSWILNFAGMTVGCFINAKITLGSEDFITFSKSFVNSISHSSHRKLKQTFRNSDKLTEVEEEYFPDVKHFWEAVVYKYFRVIKLMSLISCELSR